MRVILNSKAIEVYGNISVLELARRENVFIPSLCYEGDLTNDSRCFVCLVEINGRLRPACSTYLAEDMSIRTEGDDIKKNQRMALELLFSEHRGNCFSPCLLACPANIKVEEMLKHTVNGDIKQAYDVMAQDLPFPRIVGRVCPAFCEKECNRSAVDAAVGIRDVKRFIGDQFKVSSKLGCFARYKEIEGKDKILIVGGGPSGLSAAYYLLKKGYEVVIIEKMPKLGGLLRYGIPEYRLPKKVLDEELAYVFMPFQDKLKIALNCAFKEEMISNFKATILAWGCMQNIEVGMGNANQALDVLKDISMGHNLDYIGDTVAVVGGGNSAIDVARSLVRLGRKVTIVYRRDKESMPAEASEINYAECEGVKFKFLLSPVSYIDKQLKLKAMKVTAGGDRAKKAIEPTGEVVNLEFDNVVLALGALSEIGQYDKHPIISPTRLLAQQNPIFAAGDYDREPGTVIEAIQSGKIVSKLVDNWLKGAKLTDGITKVIPLSRSKDLYLKKYFKNGRTLVKKVIETSRFKEIESTMTKLQARTESKRCLKCSCKAQDACQLRDISLKLNLESPSLTKTVAKTDYQSEKIIRDDGKCILCGKCVSICNEIGVSALAFYNRGIYTRVYFDSKQCIACGKCVDVCPTGAMSRAVSFSNDSYYDNYCVNCNFLCAVKIGYYRSQVNEVRSQAMFSEICVKANKNDMFTECEEGKLILPIYSLEEIENALSLNDKLRIYIPERMANLDVSKTYSKYDNVLILKTLLDRHPVLRLYKYNLLKKGFKVFERDCGENCNLICDVDRYEENRGVYLSSYANLIGVLKYMKKWISTEKSGDFLKLPRIGGRYIDCFGTEKVIKPF